MDNTHQKVQGKVNAAMWQKDDGMHSVYQHCQMQQH